jgi:hypothetical protein
VVAQIAKEDINALLVKQEFVTVLTDHSGLSLDVIRNMAGAGSVAMEPDDLMDIGGSGLAPPPPEKKGKLSLLWEY